MYVEKETDKALLMVHDAVSFWIKKGWLRADKTLTPCGQRAFNIAQREQARHFGFDALHEFELVRQTEKALLLRCAVEHSDGSTTQKEFWMPRSMTGNYNFVAAKVKEIEKAFPFIGTRVRWSGAKASKPNEGAKVWKEATILER